MGQGVDGKLRLDRITARRYGLQWWSLGDHDAYSTVGLQGQFIYVDPCSKTVFVKIGYFPPGDEVAAQETAAFLEAASTWTPK